jgi:insertion element IS1 protein InsB
MCAKITDNRFPACTRCGSQDIIKNGFNGAGNQQYLCKSCGRVYVPEPYLKKDIITIADRMLLAEIPVRVITEVLTGFVSRRWLYSRKGELDVG